ncbi:MAG: hypothetical protein ACKESC_01600 [Candidatus Hodgkinia cicadicola]
MLWVEYERNKIYIATIVAYSGNNRVIKNFREYNTKYLSLLNEYNIKMINIGVNLLKPPLLSIKHIILFEINKAIHALLLYPEIMFVK